MFISYQICTFHLNEIKSIIEFKNSNMLDMQNRIYSWEEFSYCVMKR